MSAKFTRSFKIQAVEKALNRKEGVRLEDIAGTLGVGFSTLQRWIRQSKDQELETVSIREIPLMTSEKRPQDWSLEERLEMVIACGALDDEAISELCRTKGIYPHHVNQWKSDFVSGKNSNSSSKQADSKNLRSENKALKKELNRKEKALAEAAALLVLQKKVNAMWGSDDEDGSQ